MPKLELKTYVFYNPGFSMMTGKALAKALGAVSGSKGRYRADVMIRWGNSDRVKYLPKRVINKRDSLIRSIDKHWQRITMRHAGVRMPAEKLTAPCVAKERHHMKGRGVHFFGTNEEVDSFLEQRGGYADVAWQDWIPKLREFRVHVICGRFICDEKVPMREEFRKKRVWNFENGFVFKRAILDETVLQCIEEARSAVMALGLQVGAVDVAIDKRSMSPVVFEVNSAPALREQHIERYSQILRNVIRNMAREMKGFRNIFEAEV